MTRNATRITLLSLALSVLSLQSQSQELAKLSPLTQRFLQKTAGTASKIVPNYVYKVSNGQTFVSALIKVQKNIDPEAFRQMGVFIGTKAGDIWTAQIPVTQVAAFIKLPGIAYIQLDEPVFPTMDSVRKVTRVDSVHAGINLPTAYNGTGVVMGIIDAGFDFTHPNLYDTTGSSMRISRVWLQKTQGTPPGGFSYGKEITDSNAIWATGTDNATLSHGTHVTGIAAGSGFGGSGTNNVRYRGIAYKSELVLVGITPAQSEWINTGVSDMIDGMNYIYTYAASVGKPAVVNLSWGSPLGPRDGSSLFSQACDNLTGKGKIFVCAGGNNGQDSLHIQKTFTAADTVINTFLNVATNPGGKKTWVDVWGDTAKTFCMKVTLYNGATPLGNTGYFCLDNTIHSTYLIGSNNDTCFLSFTTSAAEFNQKPRIFLDVYSKVADSICISLKASDGKINMWNAYVLDQTGYYGNFTSNNKPWAISGDNKMTISDIAATRSAITVASFTSKLRFTSVAGGSYSFTGTLRALAPYSSLGPTADGRTKPDIAGPGHAVASSINSFDTSFGGNGVNYISGTSLYTKPSTNKTYEYAMLSGTSMASPAVSGIVALMLQANKYLDPKKTMDILAQTAITDNFTGTIPAGGSNLWGYGKVNAYWAVKRAIETGVPGVTGNPLLNACQLYPNPNKGHFQLAYQSTSTEKVQVAVYNLAGQLQSTQQWAVVNGNNTKDFDCTNLSKGIYFVELLSVKGTALMKIVIE